MSDIVENLPLEKSTLSCARDMWNEWYSRKSSGLQDLWCHHGLFHWIRFDLRTFDVGMTSNL